MLAPAPTPTPTRALTGATLAPSPVVRGELPTESAATAFIGQNDMTAASLPANAALPPLPVGTVDAGAVRQEVVLTLANGGTVAGSLYTSGAARRPGVLMLAPSSADWLDLPLRLDAAGFTVLTVDAGALTEGDFGVLLVSLSEVGTVDPARVAVVGAEAGADLALAGCAVDMLCDALAIVSPTQTDPLLVAMQNYHPRPLFAAAATGDAAGLAAIESLNSYAGGLSGFERPEGTGRGALLMQASPALGDRLIQWLRGQMGV